MRPELVRIINMKTQPLGSYVGVLGCLESLYFWNLDNINAVLYHQLEAETFVSIVLPTLPGKKWWVIGPPSCTPLKSPKLLTKMAHLIKWTSPIHRMRATHQPKQNLIQKIMSWNSPKDLVGKTFLMDPEPDGQRFRAKIAQLVNKHEADLQLSLKGSNFSVN